MEEEFFPQRQFPELLRKKTGTTSNSWALLETSAWAQKFIQYSRCLGANFAFFFYFIFFYLWSLQWLVSGGLLVFCIFKKYPVYTVHPQIQECRINTDLMASKGQPPLDGCHVFVIVLSVRTFSCNNDTRISGRCWGRMCKECGFAVLASAQTNRR